MYNENNRIEISENIFLFLISRRYRKNRYAPVNLGNLVNFELLYH